METTLAQLSSCLGFMRESLKTGSQEEVLSMKSSVVRTSQASEGTDHTISSRHVDTQYRSKCNIFSLGRCRHSIVQLYMGKYQHLVFRTDMWAHFSLSIALAICRFFCFLV